MTKVVAMALCGALVGMSLVGVLNALGVMIVHTPSIAEGVYLREPVHGEALRRGDIVCLDATSDFAPRVLRDGISSGRFPALWRAETLVKHVAALSGAQLAYEEGSGVLVNGDVLPNSVRKSVDLAGRPLPSPAALSRLPEGQVWLASYHRDGFDSRYIGPVDIRALTCRAQALWTF